jgi:hypothetical protein
MMGTAVGELDFYLVTKRERNPWGTPGTIAEPPPTCIPRFIGRFTEEKGRRVCLGPKKGGLKDSRIRA